MCIRDRFDALEDVRLDYDYILLDCEFKIVRRVRISYIDPIVDLTSAAVQLSLIHI